MHLLSQFEPVGVSSSSVAFRGQLPKIKKINKKIIRSEERYPWSKYTTIALSKNTSNGFFVLVQEKRWITRNLYGEFLFRFGENLSTLIYSDKQSSFSVSGKKKKYENAFESEVLWGFSQYTSKANGNTRSFRSILRFHSIRSILRFD